MNENVIFNQKFSLEHKVFGMDENDRIIVYHSNENPYFMTTLKNILQNKYNNRDISMEKIEMKKFIEIIRNEFSDLTEEDILGENSEFFDKNIQNIYEDAPVINLFNEIIMTAIERGATDVHIEAYENFAQIKYRIGLYLTEYKSINKKNFENLSLRIKYIAKLNVNETRLPQDGKTSLDFNEMNIELRVSIIPTKNGESIVLRLLKIEKEGVELGQLGFDKKSEDLIKKISRKNTGMIICTGPTGSGKTTTLHSIIKYLNDGNKKIITLEDPVEYKLEGINQIQVNDEIGLSFSTLLRRVLRHDPDIIMVGEIRDNETAKLAFSASLTGHLVLTTLHTNDTISTFQRLKDLGVESYLVESSLRMIISQRLVRKLCSQCREDVEIPEEYREKFDFARAYRPVGCKKCDYRGFDGLTILYEILTINENEKKILQTGSLSDLEEYLKKSEFTSIYDTGKEKIINGIISFEDYINTLE